MRRHKIEIPKLATCKQLEALHLSKEECFANLEGSFDYAVPQQWLDKFANWCRDNAMTPRGTTYDLIRSTTVWVYPESEPMTCCAEVYYAYQRYQQYLERGN